MWLISKNRIKNWDILLQARAIENQAYVCGVNCVGTDGLGIDYNGHSTLLDFKATPLLSFPENETSIQTYELSREPLLKFREKSAFWKDADKFSDFVKTFLSVTTQHPYFYNLLISDPYKV